MLIQLKPKHHGAKRLGGEMSREWTDKQGETSINHIFMPTWSDALNHAVLL